MCAKKKSEPKKKLEPQKKASHLEALRLLQPVLHGQRLHEGGLARNLAADLAKWLGRIGVASEAVEQTGAIGQREEY